MITRFLLLALPLGCASVDSSSSEPIAPSPNAIRASPGAWTTLTDLAPMMQQEAQMAEPQRVALLESQSSEPEIPAPAIPQPVEVGHKERPLGATLGRWTRLNPGSSGTFTKP